MGENEGSVGVWDMGSHYAMHDMETHTGADHHTSVDRAGDVFATAAEDGIVHVWHGNSLYVSLQCVQLRLGGLLRRT